jgi:hypothetical protein
MATNASLTCISLVAAANLSANQYYAMRVSAADTVNVANAAGIPVVGILQNKPSAAGHEATIAYTGVTKAVAGGAVAAGALVKVLANGKLDDASTATTVDASGASATAASTGAHVIGMALTAAGGDGVVFEVLLTHSGAVPGTSA